MRNTLVDAEASGFQLNNITRPVLIFVRNKINSYMITSAVKIIRYDFIELKTWLSDWLFYRRRAIKMKLAISLADMKQRAFNKRYFVVLLETGRGDKLVSINNAEFKKLKRKKWLPKKMSYLDLENECFYQTSTRDNNKSTAKERKAAQNKYRQYAKRFLK